MTKYMSLAVFDTESWLFSLLKNSLAISQVWITIVNVSHSVKEQQRFMKNNVLALVQRSTQAHEFLWSISAETTIEVCGTEEMLMSSTFCHWSEI